MKTCGSFMTPMDKQTDPIQNGLDCHKVKSCHDIVQSELSRLRSLGPSGTKQGQAEFL